MPSLDNCINGIYTPGNIGASSGEPPTQSYAGSLLDPNDYNPDGVTYSWDFSKFYNSFHLGAF